MRVLLAAILAWCGAASANPDVCALAENAAPVEVVSLNAWGLPAPISRPGVRERLPQIAEWLHRDYDVVGLQEVWRGTRRYFHGKEHLADDADGDSGLGLVSRWPVEGDTTRHYHHAVGFDALKKKGLFHARVHHPAGDFAVVVTHLQAGQGRRFAQVRARQVEELLAELPQDDGPVLVLGDFNLYDDDPLDQATAAALEKAGLRDAAVALHDVRETYPASHHRFDRIWFRDGGRHCWVPDETATVADFGLSDHVPLFVRLQFGTRRAATPAITGIATP